MAKRPTVLTGRLCAVAMPGHPRAQSTGAVAAPRGLLAEGCPSVPSPSVDQAKLPAGPERKNLARPYEHSSMLPRTR
jgi:hypothetical protein